MCRFTSLCYMYVHSFERDVYIHISSVRGYVCIYIYTYTRTHPIQRDVHTYNVYTCVWNVRIRVYVCGMYMYVCTYMYAHSFRRGVHIRVSSFPFQRDIHLRVYVDLGCTYTYTYMWCTYTCIRICMYIPFEGMYMYVYTN